MIYISTTIAILTNQRLALSDYLELVRSEGGQISQAGVGFLKGIITRGESTIWLYFRGEALNLDSNEQSRLKEAHSFTPKTSIAIDISSEEGSGHLALETCRSFMKKLKSSVVDDSFGNFYDENQINNMMVDDEGNWLKKS